MLEATLSPDSQTIRLAEEQLQKAAQTNLVRSNKNNKTRERDSTMCVLVYLVLKKKHHNHHFITYIHFYHINNWLKMS